MLKSQALEERESYVWEERRNKAETRWSMGLQNKGSVEAVGPKLANADLDACKEPVASPNRIKKYPFTFVEKLCSSAKNKNIVI
jgi:hypothetical protein